MKIKICFNLLFLFIISMSVYAGDRKNSYTGVWKLDMQKTPPTNSRIFLSKISFNFKSDTLFTVRTYENSNGETFPFNENLTMNGNEYKIVIYDLPRKARAYLGLDGALVIESTTTFNGNSGEENFSLVETWKAGENETMLTVDFAAKSSAGDSKGTYYYLKSE